MNAPNNTIDAMAAFSPAPCSALPPVLDACCGSKSFWFDKQDTRAIFTDRRTLNEQVDNRPGRQPLIVSPDLEADFTSLPFPDGSFSMVVLDPPHIVRENPSGYITKYYGALDRTWPEMLRAGFAECFRVLKDGGFLVFKWNEVEIPLTRILALTPEKPLFGHKSGKTNQTHWVCFMKQNAKAEALSLSEVDPPAAGSATVAQDSRI